MSIADKLSIAFQESPPSLVRNVCIVAHVDHGKTTLADFLISANGIISARLAGKLRYMDSREDEQVRGITMKSSAISLYYEPLLLNLIDSPGHVDFCTEVSSAVNLADIAILLVDAVEGVCSQTESLIRQSLARNLEIILVINKIDRLVVELKKSESDAHQHLQKLIESINVCLSKEIQGQLLEEDWRTVEQIENHFYFNPAKGNVIFASALYGYAFTIEDFTLLWAKHLIGHQNAETNAVNDTTESITKQPIANNSLYESFCQHLFSRDHYFSKKDGEIYDGAEQKEKQTLFEQFVLEPLWELHKCALIQKNIDRLCTLALKLGLPTLKGKRPDEAFPELMRGWLPLSACIIRACSRCRSAEKAYQLPKWERINGRLRKLFLHDNENIDDNFPQELPYTAQCLLNCDPNDPVTIVFAAKSSASDHLKGVDQHQQQRRILLCRVMSGTLKNGDQLFIFKTKSKNEIITHESINCENKAQDQCWHPIPVRLTSLFMLSGRELLQVERVPAGRICGIEVNDGEWVGVGAHLFCSHSLAKKETPRMDLCAEQQKFTESLVRVTIRPANPGASEMSELRDALQRLTILDSAVRIMEQEDGELAMLTAGEVHLQKCLADLNALGQTNLDVSKPIVSFLETLVPWKRDVVPYAKILTDQLTECYLRQFSMRIRLRAVPLWGIESDTHNLLTLLQENASLIDGISNPIQRTQVDAFRTELMECACECLPRLKGSWWPKRKRIDIQRLFSNGILAFGPAKAKLNILFNNNAIADLTENGDARREVSVWKANLRSLEQAIVCGFHLAMSHGPLCDEPMQAVGIVLEEWLVEGDNQLHQYEQCQTKSENEEFTIVQGQQYNGKESDERTDVSENGRSRKCEQAVEDKNGSNFNGQSKALPIAYLHGNAQLHGQLISAIQQTCMAALKKHKGALRLLAAMYQCHVQTQDKDKALKKVLAVLKQKRAKIEKSDELISGLYEIVAHMPVVESFSFCDQLRKQSSGTASAQLEFFDWKLIDEDPYWEPSTPEEVEEFGRTGGVTLQKNQARQYMDAVRRRKGLPTEDLIVVSAEKQRNLKKNK